MPPEIETRAVVFDLDGVLLDSELAGTRLRRGRYGRTGPLARRRAGAMLGMSSPEWSRYMHEELGVPSSPM